MMPFGKAKMRAYGNWCKRKAAYNDAIDDVMRIVRKDFDYKTLRREIRRLKIKEYEGIPQ